MKEKELVKDFWILHRLAPWMLYTEPFVHKTVSVKLILIIFFQRSTFMSGINFMEIFELNVFTYRKELKSENSALL